MAKASTDTLTLPVRTLRAIASAASAAIEVSTAIPILQNLHLYTTHEGGEVTLHANGTNLDIETGAAAVLDGSQPPLSITLPGRALADFAQRLDEGGMAALTPQADGRLTVSCGRTRYILSSLPGQDFPRMETGAFEHAITVPASGFAAALKRTLVSASIEETRYYLNGAFLHAAANPAASQGLALTMTSTDGHRLTCLTLTDSDGAPLAAPQGMPGIIIPRATMALAIPLVDGAGSGMVEVAFNAAKIRLHDPVTLRTLTSKLVDATYPEYSRVIPPLSAPSTPTLVDRAALEALAGRAMRIATEKDRRVRLTPEAGGISAQSGAAPDSGAALEDWVAASMDGDPSAPVTLNARYLKEIAGTLPGDRALLYLPTDGNAPIRIAPADSKGHALPHDVRVLMPIRA
jgi:DNA polymerase III subunit beta